MNLLDEQRLLELRLSEEPAARSLGAWMEAAITELEDGAANLEKERDEAMEEVEDYAVRRTSAHDDLEGILFDPLADDIPDKLKGRLVNLLTDLET